MELNKNINNLRKKKGFSQEYLAEEIKVSRQTISNWEVGETNPNPEQLLLLSKIFEVSVDELLGNKMKFNKKDNLIKDETIFLGATLISGGIAFIWSFSANRFRDSEIAIIILIGALIGYGIGLVINSIIKRFEYINNLNNQDKEDLNKRK